MRIELGNPAPRSIEPDGRITVLDGGPRVTYIQIPDNESSPRYERADDDPDGPGALLEEGGYRPYSLDVNHGLDIARIGLHIAQTDAVTHLPGLEPLLVVANRPGAWAEHANDAPSWVRVDAGGGTDHPEEYRELERLLSAFYDCPVAPPIGDDLGWERHIQDSHHTLEGMPGVGFDPLLYVKALKTNAGNDIQARQMFGFTTVFGQRGTATATSATSLTGGTESPGGSHASNDCLGMIITDGKVYGLITANTTGTSPVYTVDRWYECGSPGGTAGTTPGSTTTYCVIAGSPPAWFMGLTANAGAPASGDTTLTGEITTAGGGLIRKICPLAHTAGTNTQTLTPVFTANGTDALPVTIAKIGVSQSLLSAFNQIFQTLLNATATLSASGDQLTVTETVTM